MFGHRSLRNLKLPSEPKNPAERKRLQQRLHLLLLDSLGVSHGIADSHDN
jgi:hypothetical protein